MVDDYVCIISFFFQAEDGIRDKLVTGVQTCALPISKIEVKKPELDLAVKLIEQAATDEFHPEKYKDHVRERMMEQIERKVEGKQITEEPEEAPKTKVLDLMQALKQSLEKEPAAEREKPAKRRKVAGKR